MSVRDASGAQVGSELYHSFGKTRVESGTIPTDKKFTGQIADGSTGIYYYGARYYDPDLRRFIQADTIAPQPGNPQSLNRYSYTLNNPLRYVDPTGHAPQDLVNGHEDWFDEGWRGGFGSRGPQAADYVSKYKWSAEGAGYTGETIMKDITAAIGRESPPPGEDDWLHDLVDFGTPFPKQLRWGNVRIVFSTGGWKGGLASVLQGGKLGAVTFAANLIVFTTDQGLDFNLGGNQRLLMHELAHVMQAQAFGEGWWWEYIEAWRRAGYEKNGYEILARLFADRSMARPLVQVRSAQPSPPLPGGNWGAPGHEPGGGSGYQDWSDGRNG